MIHEIAINIGFFLLGGLVGMVVAILVYLVTINNQEEVENVLQKIEDIKFNKKSADQGFVYMAPTDADIERERIISENDKKGVDTPLADLQN